MNNKKDKKKKSDEIIIPAIFGWQKVRFYKIKHFIFDFGGVLLIGKTFVLRILFQIIEDDLKYNIYDEDKKYLNKLRRQLRSGRMTSKEFLENLFNHIQKTDGELAFKKIDVGYYLELWINLYMQLTQLDLEMAEIIERLHQSKYKVSLMSNTIDIHAKGNKLKGFYDLFDDVFLSNEIGLRKPDIFGYKYVLNQLKTTPEKCIFIDDKLKNLIPARELGIIVIKYDSIEKFKSQLDELNIINLTKEKRREIKNKYLQYKTTKKEFIIVEKEYLKAKKQFLDKKEKSINKRLEYQEKKINYEKKRLEYKSQKKIKKEELMKKFKGI